MRSVLEAEDTLYTRGPPCLGVGAAQAVLLTASPTAGVEYPFPGDAKTRAALGYQMTACSQRVLLALSLVAACSRAIPAAPAPVSPAPAPTVASTPVPMANSSASPEASTGPAAPPQIDPDGDDDTGEANEASF